MKAAIRDKGNPPGPIGTPIKAPPQQMRKKIGIKAILGIQIAACNLIKPFEKLAILGQSRHLRRF